MAQQLGQSWLNGAHHDLTHGVAVWVGCYSWMSASWRNILWPRVVVVIFWQDEAHHQIVHSLAVGV